MTDLERERINAICKVAGISEIDDLSDGFHTFRQLYYQRMMLFAVIVKQNHDRAWKSLRHEDGELCFGGGWFIVGIDTPEGSYTYHYENKYFDLFDCEILDYGKHWDGHTEKDVTRLLSLPKAQLFSEGTTSDMISRQWLMECVNEGWIKFDTEKDENRFIHLVRDIAPSAQPEQLERCPIYDGVCGYPSDQCYDCPRHHGVQPEPQWIPVSERLPETGVEVLTYDEALNYIEIQTVSDGRWENQRGDWQDLDGIAAWMPLPTPYTK